jgi:cardiolipin synthase
VTACQPASGAVDRLITSTAERKSVVLDVIRQARREIKLSLFRCNDPDVFEELSRATARGVAIDVLVTARAKGDRSKLEKLWRRLEETGASLHPYGDPVVKYHAKYMVADDGPAMVASLNLTRKCFARTLDAVVLTHDACVIEGLERLMHADRHGLPAPEDLSERLIVGPERARRQFTNLIKDARTSIRLIDAKLSDPDLVTLLNTKRATGVAVEVLDSKRLGDLKSHGKIMVIDDRIAVVGSLALAALSLDFRREVAIIVDEPSAVAEAMALFRSNNLPAGQQAPSEAAGEAQC